MRAFNSVHFRRREEEEMQLSQNKSQKSAYPGEPEQHAEVSGTGLGVLQFILLKEDLNTVNIYKNVQRS